MEFRNAIRMFGGAAILAGILRIAEELSVTGQSPQIPPSWRQPLYWTIDTLILVALIGIALKSIALNKIVGARRDRFGIVGWTGWIFAVAGVALLRASFVTFDGVDRYQLAAGLLTFGMALMGAVALLRRLLPPWICVVWISTFAIAIASLLLPAQTHWLQQAAAVAFGVGLIGVGGHLISSEASASA